MQLLIAKRTRSLFFDPKSATAMLLCELGQLKHDLKMTVPHEPLRGIVRFFDLVSKWHDRTLKAEINAFKKVNYGQHDHIIATLEMLDGAFSSAGRCEHGWNRTEKAQTVTAERVFLGDIYGLWTKPVSYWITTKDDPDGGNLWGRQADGSPITCHQIISGQADQFIRAKTKWIIELIDKLKDQLAEL